MKYQYQGILTYHIYGKGIYDKILSNKMQEAYFTGTLSVLLNKVLYWDLSIVKPKT